VLEHLLAEEQPPEDADEAPAGEEAAPVEPPEESGEPVEEEKGVEPEQPKMDIWADVYQPVREAIYPDEEGKPLPPPYQGHLDDPNYQFFIEKLKSFKP
jgi:hypothetical protein